MTKARPNARIGHFVETAAGGERVRAYVPPPLPPTPPLRTTSLLVLLEEASRELGRLDGMASTLPDTQLFLYMYVRKEAVLSSQIEGTQSSLSDLLLHESKEAPGAPLDDVQEVSNYVAATNHGLAKLHEGFPLSLRLIREIHAKLLVRGRGAGKLPGEFRSSQNWIGGTRPGNAIFVPPPVNEMQDALSKLEAFLHSSNPSLPLLIKAGLTHVQFETIHPFLDGNGRVGRLLITLLLCASGSLSQPLLYLSLYFKENRSTYYELLQRVRETGDWETWTEFFLTGVRDIAQQATAAAREILGLFNEDRQTIEKAGRPASSFLRVHHLLQLQPITSIPAAADKLKLSRPTVSKALDYMQTRNIVAEVTGRRRERLFAYRRYLDILSEGTAPNADAQ